MPSPPTAATFPQSSNAVKFADQVGDVQTVETFLCKWLNRQKKHLKASTYNGYRKIVVSQLIPWLDTIMLSALRKKDVHAKLEPMTATNKTMTNIRSVLRKALDDAIEDELIEVNPLARGAIPRSRRPSRRTISTRSRRRNRRRFSLKQLARGATCCSLPSGPACARPS